MADPYLVLGVERDASATEIEDAFKKTMMRKYSPFGGIAPRGARISDVEQAYLVLRDPALRAEYDRATAEREAFVHRPKRKKR